MATKIKTRCEWCLKDEAYMDYHDNVWGIPEHDNIRLFEFLNLEGAQAGLSWHTILKKMDTYKIAFADWNPQKIAKFSPSKIEKLLQDPGIIRNKLKVNAVITNAKLYLEMEKNGESLNDYLWDFVNGKPIINTWKTFRQVPSETPLSQKMSKDLKKRGFKFVGPTIIYAFMQATGMVDDHLPTCWKRQ